MKYVELGQTGLNVSRLCVGAGVRGELDPPRFVRTIQHAVDSGCTFFDSAPGYGQGHSEALLGEALAGRRDGVVVTSKAARLSRASILESVEQSLRNLRTDWIDVYFMHHPDPKVPMEETLLVLDELVRDGKIRYIGASNHSAVQVVQLLRLASELRLETLSCLQDRYNLLARDPVESTLLPLVRRFGLGLMTYSALAVGLLSGRFRLGSPVPAFISEPLDERGDRVVRVVIDIAAELGFTPAQIAIAWLLDHPEVSAPIVGADSPEFVDEAFGALRVQLSQGDRARLDEVARSG